MIHHWLVEKDFCVEFPSTGIPGRVLTLKTPSLIRRERGPSISAASSQNLNHKPVVPSSGLPISVVSAGTSSRPADVMRRTGFIKSWVWPCLTSKRRSTQKNEWSFRTSAPRTLQRAAGSSFHSYGRNQVHAVNAAAAVRSTSKNPRSVKRFTRAWELTNANAANEKRVDRYRSTRRGDIE